MSKSKDRILDENMIDFSEQRLFEDDVKRKLESLVIDNSVKFYVDLSFNYLLANSIDTIVAFLVKHETVSIDLSGNYIWWGDLASRHDFTDIQR